ncbi:choline ABC transporter substrate-binding protein [uncultured Aquitalea sp.]|uniref:choline ABC transporter substrate-binding protein n=1 Tax=uncultured Aquitalea sp. TaxID=540272 RepID=UPI0025CCB6BC|nr:choline ABC transporter substrate-binding protein [uncultured Aquitalea sp.]
MNKTSVIVLGSVAMLAAQLAAADTDSCREVRMSGPGWSDIRATNAVAGVLLESLGYKQKLDHLSVPITYLGLAKNQLDVFLGNWMPAQKHLVEPKLKDGSIEQLQANLKGAKFTLAVPDYVAAAGVRNFADLARFQDRFERKIYGIEPGAPANQSLKTMLDKHDFGLNGWSLMESSETGMMTQVARKVAAKEWIVFLGWEPHVMNTKYKLSYLSGGDAYFGPDYGGATVNTVTRRGYAEQCPNPARLFKQLRFDVDMENRMVSAFEDPQANDRAVAIATIKAQPEALKNWLAGVKTANGGEGLPAVQKALGLK